MALRLHLCSQSTSSPFQTISKPTQPRACFGDEAPQASTFSLEESATQQCHPGVEAVGSKFTSYVLWTVVLAVAQRTFEVILFGVHVIELTNPKRI